jgi:hypothetical protein
MSTRESLADLIVSARYGAPLHPVDAACDRCRDARAAADAILAAGWTPPPRVFLEGDEIPCHLPVIDNHGEVRDDFQEFDEGDGEVYTANYDVVEMNIDYDGAVARERARRERQS